MPLMLSIKPDRILGAFDKIDMTGDDYLNFLSLDYFYFLLIFFLIIDYVLDNNDLMLPIILLT